MSRTRMTGLAINTMAVVPFLVGAWLDWRVVLLGWLSGVMAKISSDLIREGRLP